MTNDPEVPTSIGPWQVREVIFVESYRRCYRVGTGALLADIVILDPPGSRVGILAGDVDRSKAILTYEIPKVLDSSLGQEPYWIASDDAHGKTLSLTLEESGPLDPAAWAELAKTALIGCAALRSARVTNFQLSPNTFMVDGDEIHMCNYWSTKLDPGPFAPPGRIGLQDLGPADDKFAISRLLTLAMGLPLDKPLTLETIVPSGYTAEHIRYLKDLASTDPVKQLSTESALRSIPGRDPSWNVPVFALDKAWQPRMKRRAQRTAIWVSLAAMVAAVALVGLNWLTGSLGESGSESEASAAESSAPSTPTRIVRIRAFEGEFPDKILENASLYQIDLCLKRGDLDLGPDAPDPKLQELVEGKWTTTARRAVVTDDTDCGKRQVRVSFSGLATNSPATEEWGPCQSLQLVVPRKAPKKPLKIQYCVEQRSEYR